MQISENNEDNLMFGVPYKEKLRKKQAEAIEMLKEQIKILETWHREGEPIDDIYMIQEGIDAFRHGMDFAFYTKEVVCLIARYYSAYSKCFNALEKSGKCAMSEFSNFSLWCVDILCKRNGFSKSELENLCALQKVLAKYDAPLMFKDGTSTIAEVYSLNQAITAYTQLNTFADSVKKQNLSIIEKLALCYTYTTSRAYSKNEETAGKARDLISVLNNDDIVCVGYANIFQNLCSQLGLDCKNLTIKMVDRASGREGYHMYCRVYIDDPKYKVRGYFDFDPTFDSRKKEQVEKNLLNNFAYFMIPTGDYKNNKNKKVSYADSFVAMQEEAFCFERIPFGNEDIMLDHKSNKNFQKTILPFEELQELYSALGLTPKMLVQGSKQRTIENAQKVCDNSGQEVLNNFQKYCPNLLKYKLPQKIIMKALAYEIAEPEGEKDSQEYKKVYQLLQEAKVDFYQSLNDFIAECKSQKIRADKRMIQKNQEAIVDYATAFVDLPMLQTKMYMRVVEEVQLLDYAEKRLHKTSAGLSLRDYYNIIKKVVAYTGLDDNPNRVMKETIKHAICGYNGISALTSNRAVRWLKYEEAGLGGSFMDGIMEKLPAESGDK